MSLSHLTSHELRSPGRIGTSRSAALPPSARRCRLTTFAWTGAEVETSARLGLADGRLYVRLAATSPALERIWNTASVRVVPCTRTGRPTGPVIEGRARVLAAQEDEDLLVEIVPAAG
jgi:PPOX class probable F420-dependent enzyme